ncbi:MAG: hypothetical protein PHN80_16690 [Hespellia sp.]|nr:hypothetical protein [Hespellia sp.]
MKNLLIIGAGQYGRLVKELAETIGYKKIDFLDDLVLDTVGKIQDLPQVQENYEGCVIAIGNPEFRKKIFKIVERPMTLIHPSAVISKSAIVEAGCVIESNVVINTNAVIEAGSFICAGAVVNHNSVVKKFSQIDCNAVVAAKAIVPEGTKVYSCTVWNNNLRMAVGKESFF